MTFGVRATNGDFLELVRRYLGAFLVEVDAGADVALFSADWGAEQRLPGGKMVRGKRNLYFGTMNIFGGPVAEEMAARLVSYVRELSHRQANDFLRIRAGAVVVDGKAVLLPSPPEPHLAALVGRLVARGGAFLGDEMVKIDPVSRDIYPTTFPMFIDSDDLPLFPELNRERSRGRRGELSEFLRAATPRRLVAPEELHGEWGEPASPGWIVFPYFGDTEEGLEPFGGAEALFRFTGSALNLHVWGDRGLGMMREMLNDLPVSRLGVRSIPEAADRILEAAPQIMEGDR